MRKQQQQLISKPKTELEKYLEFQNHLKQVNKELNYLDVIGLKYDKSNLNNIRIKKKIYYVYKVKHVYTKEYYLGIREYVKFNEHYKDDKYLGDKEFVYRFNENNLKKEIIFETSDKEKAERILNQNIIKYIDDLNCVNTKYNPWLIKDKDQKLIVKEKMKLKIKHFKKLEKLKKLKHQ